MANRSGKTVRGIAGIAFFLGFSVVLFGNPALADFSLGNAANYGVIAGPNTSSLVLGDSMLNPLTITSNVATDRSSTSAGGSYVQFGSGTIKGNLDFAGTAQTSLGGGTVNGSVNGNVSAVSLAYAQVTNLSNTYGTGTDLANAVTITPSNPSTIVVSNGYNDGTGTSIFKVAASANLFSSPLTIVGGATSQYVVIDVTGSSTDNVSFTGPITLTGGLTSDHVIFNFLNSGAQVGGTINSGSLNGVVLALGESINFSDSTINGRIFGGGGGSFSLKGDTVYASVVPEPSRLILMAIGGLFVGVYARSRRRRVVKISRAI